MMKGPLIKLSTIIILMAMFGLAWALGVLAGRHNWTPVPQLFAVKDRIERAVFPTYWWQRHLNVNSETHTPVPCPVNPIVLVFGGQSNVANSLSVSLDSDPELAAFMFWDGQCYPLADPMLGPSGQGGSVATAIGQALARETGRPVVVMNAAVSATSFAAWLNPRTGIMGRLETALESLRAAGLKPGLMIWQQGETDSHHRSKSQAEFEVELKALLSQLLDMPDMDDRSVMLFRSTICAGNRASPHAALQAALTAMPDYNPRIILGPDTDLIGPRGRHDGCHFNARGRDAIVTGIMPLLRRHFGDRLD